jgi:hypothetical protein
MNGRRDMRLFGAISDWSVEQIVAMSVALGGLLTGFYAFLKWWLTFRSKSQKQSQLLDIREMVDAELASEVIGASHDIQREVQLVNDRSAAHHTILFHTHNGDGIPKPAQQIKSTADLEAYKHQLRPIKPDWIADPVRDTFAEFLLQAISKQGEAILIDADKLPDCPMKDRFAAWRVPYALLTYVDSIDHFPTFLLACYGGAEKAERKMNRQFVVMGANAIRARQRLVAAKKARVAAIEAKLTKTFEDAEETETP